ncbi:MAG: aminoglycoside phosphotransferase family protein [bacterium]|nr:aminoglycoside phosphotransferase family protein [bacterium]
MTPELQALAAHVVPDAVLVEARALGAGLINRSFVATYRSARGLRRYVHQRINPDVFRDVPALLRNLAIVVTHVRERDPSLVPHLVTAPDGALAWRAPDGAWWRTMHYVEDASPIAHDASLEQCYRAAHAFGRFARATADLATPRLAETIPGFHDTPARLAAFDAAREADRFGRAAACADVLERLGAHRARAARITDALRSGILPVRVAHNDAKLDNVLLGPTRACVIDLDTTMPGTPVFDFGDLARSAATRAREDEPDIATVTLDLERYRALREGFCDGAGDALGAAERAAFAAAAQTMAYEQALRFATDHLAGDPYYRIAYPGHNAARARVQLALFEALLANERSLDQ